MIGLIPAAGRGNRFSGVGPKELASLDEPHGPPVCHVALDAMRRAGVERVVVVVSPEKPLIREVLGPRVNGLDLTYVVQPKPRGLPDAVRCAIGETKGHDVLFAMPDTVFVPHDGLSRLVAEHRRTAADVTLGVFPTDVPTQLAPVELDAAGRVTALYDKPAATSLGNTWGLVVWSPRFSVFCAEFAERREDRRESTLTDAIDRARAEAWPVRALSFADGAFCDAGTVEGLARARCLWAQRIRSEAGMPGRRTVAG
jgi:glucose-1-phosphate thymidylyltransferase